MPLRHVYLPPPPTPPPPPPSPPPSPPWHPFAASPSSFSGLSAPSAPGAPPSALITALSFAGACFAGWLACCAWPALLTKDARTGSDAGGLRNMCLFRHSCSRSCHHGRERTSFGAHARSTPAAHPHLRRGARAGGQDSWVLLSLLRCASKGQFGGCHVWLVGAAERCARSAWRREGNDLNEGAPALRAQTTKAIPPRSI